MHALKLPKASNREIGAWHSCPHLYLRAAEAALLRSFAHLLGPSDPLSHTRNSSLWRQLFSHHGGLRSPVVVGRRGASRHIRHAAEAQGVRALVAGTSRHVQGSERGQAAHQEVPHRHLCSRFFQTSRRLECLFSSKAGGKYLGASRRMRKGNHEGMSKTKQRFRPGGSAREATKDNRA